MTRSNAYSGKTQHLLTSHALSRELVRELSRATSRSSFFQVLSRLLQQQFAFDRLCINLYDPNSELLTYFSAAEGTVVDSLSPVRKAEKSTVAGHVIASRKPVVITDIAQHFTESLLHPMAEAGLTTTMAFPLILNDEILGTLHCSFVQKPDNLYAIMELFLELCPYVGACLGAILAMEQLEQGAAVNPLQSGSLGVEYANFIFESPVMRQFMRKANRVAKMDMPVLLLGETGTGKTHLAQYIHHNSRRKNQNFVKVNCPALASTLFESELFGHAKGSFTGAASKRVGRIELAHQGSLFLDEIAELNQEMQSKLLHFLDDRRFERVGESVSLSVDTRLIAATNVNIRTALENGRLRSDFCYRLSACTLELPPLRERQEDIPVLATYFVNQLSLLHGLPKARLSPDMMERLRRHGWPGNVRELRNVVNSLLVQNCLADDLTCADVEQALQADALLPWDGQSASRPKDVAAMPTGQIGAAKSSLKEVERRHILQALQQTKGILSGPQGAASLLGLPRSTLQHRMRKLGIERSAIR